jgi:dihydroflavonol-4-reductase
LLSSSIIGGHTLTILVTGATGFVGGHLIEELVRQNEDVEALVRKPENAINLSKMGVGLVEGDITDPSSFKGKLGKYDIIYHLANVYDWWVPDDSIFYKVNVKGTRDLLLEAKEAGVGRIVYTSTVEAIGAKKGEVGTEETVHCGYFPSEYSRSKYLGLCEAMKMTSQGVPIVIVMPGAVIGPGDTKATGQFMMAFLNHQLPGILFPDCVLGYGFVKDVSRGHILAAEKGKVGEKYILANGNYSIKEFYDIVADVAGIPRMEKSISPALTSLLSNMQTFKASVTKKPPQIPKQLVRVMKNGILVDNTKSIRELGIQYTPIKQAIKEAVEWYQAKGLVSSTKT